MRDGVGQVLPIAAAVTSMVSTGLQVASFFGSGGKKRPYITAAENKALEEQQAAKLINGRLLAMHKRLAAATTPEAVYAERELLPALWQSTQAKSLKSYTGIFGAAAAAGALKNLTAWRRPYYDQGEAQVEAMIQERIAQLEAPAMAIEAAKAAQAKEIRFAQAIAEAVAPRASVAVTPAPAATSTLLIVGLALAAVWLLTKGKI